jgi:hypothetical protein
MIPTASVEKPVEKKVTNFPEPRQCLLPTGVTNPQAAPAPCGDSYLDRRAC